MKKSLFLLPLVSGLALAGCSLFGKKEEEKPSGDDPVNPPAAQREEAREPSADITIDHAALEEFFEEDYVYPQDDYDFTLDGFKFDATAGVGHKTAEKTEGAGNYYNEQQALQFRKEGHDKGVGMISNWDPIIASQITIHWFATYASEAKKYQPVVKASTDPDALESEAGMTANEGASVDGTATGGKQRSGDGKDYDVYAYTTTYDISGKNFFSIAAPGGAMYVKDIVINK